MKNTNTQNIKTHKKYKHKKNKRTRKIHKGGVWPDFTAIKESVSKRVSAVGTRFANVTAAAKEYTDITNIILTFLKKYLYNANTKKCNYLYHIIEYIINNKISLVGIAVRSYTPRLSSYTDISDYVSCLIEYKTKLNILLQNLPNIEIKLTNDNSYHNIHDLTSRNDTLYNLLYTKIKNEYDSLFTYIKNNKNNKLNIFYYIIYEIIIKSKFVGIESSYITENIIYILKYFIDTLKIHIYDNTDMNLIDKVVHKLNDNKRIDIDIINDIFLIINIIIKNYKNILYNVTIKQNAINTKYDYDNINQFMLLFYSIQYIYKIIVELLDIVTKENFNMRKYLGYAAGLNNILDHKLRIIIEAIDNLKTLENCNTYYNDINMIDTIKLIILLFNDYNNDETYNESDDEKFYKLINELSIKALLIKIHSVLSSYNNFIYCIFDISEKLLKKYLKLILKIKMLNNTNTTATATNTPATATANTANTQTTATANTANTQTTERATATAANAPATNAPATNAPAANATAANAPATNAPANTAITANVTVTDLITIIKQTNKKYGLFINDNNIHDTFNLNIIINTIIDIIKSNINHISIEFTNINNNYTLKIKGINDKKGDLIISTADYNRFYKLTDTPNCLLKGGNLITIKHPLKQYGGDGLNPFKKIITTTILHCDFDHLINNILNDNNYLLYILLNNNSHVATFLKLINYKTEISYNTELLYKNIISILNIDINIKNSIKKIWGKLLRLYNNIYYLQNTIIQPYIQTNKNHIATTAINLFKLYINNFIHAIMKTYIDLITNLNTKKQKSLNNSIINITSSIGGHNINKLKTIIITSYINRLLNKINKITLTLGNIIEYNKIIIDIIYYILKLIKILNQYIKIDIDINEIDEILDVYDKDIVNTTQEPTEHESNNDVKCETITNINKTTIIGKLYKRLPSLINYYDIISSLYIFPNNLKTFFYSFNPYSKIDDSLNIEIQHIYKKIIDIAYYNYYYVFSYIILNTSTINKTNINLKKTYTINIHLNISNTNYNITIDFKNIKLVNNYKKPDTDNSAFSISITINDPSFIDTNNLTELLKTIFELNLDTEIIKTQKKTLLKLNDEDLSNDDKQNILVLQKILFAYNYGIYSDYFNGDDTTRINNRNTKSKKRRGFTFTKKTNKTSSNKHCIYDLTYYKECPV